MLEVVVRHDVGSALSPPEAGEDGVDDVVLNIVPIEHAVELNIDVGPVDADARNGVVLQQSVSELPSLLVNCDDAVSVFNGKIAPKQFFTDVGEICVTHSAVNMERPD